MRKIKLIGFIIFAFIPFGVFAQSQVSPHAIIEKEIRNGTSQKMRSAELERVKRDARSGSQNRYNGNGLDKFAKVKKDFELIQKLQNSIVKTYRSGKKINYKKIAKYAKSITLKASRLDVNLFGEKTRKPTAEASSAERDLSNQSVRSLIIKLDKSIGKFVINPIFKNLKTVDIKISKKAQTELKYIILFSQKLYKTSEESRK